MHLQFQQKVSTQLSGKHLIQIRFILVAMVAEQEKKKRSTEKGSFSRSITKFNKLIAAAASLSLVTEQFDKVKNCYDRLESAHNEFLLATDIDIENEDDGETYINESDRIYEDALEAYAAFLKANEKQDAVDQKVLEEEAVAKDKAVREQEIIQERIDTEAKRKEDTMRQFESEKVQLSTCISAFKRMALNVKDSLTDISAVDKRTEWSKVETEYISLRKHFSKVIGIDPSFDTTEISKAFEDDAENIFHGTQKVVLTSLKDVPLTSGGATSSSSSSRASSSTVRKEAVHLPSFKGDPNSSPHLKFPVWLSQWNKVISSYDDDFKAVMLHDHLDEHAKTKYIGYEDDYNVCMDRLEKFYGNPGKVVACVLEEVLRPADIVDGDYKELLKYSVILESNFNRLTALGYEHEISNTTQMSDIMRKFPLNIAERWHDHLATQPNEQKSKPFPLLIDWLKTRKETWENMAAIGVTKPRGALSLYTDSRGSSQKRTCYKCGDEGHIQRNCPRNKDDDNSNNNKDSQKKRKAPTVKKFWCALHKGDPNRRCFSESCRELRRTEVPKRLQLLKDNGDCSHCVGDHKSTDCNKAGRVCGGGRTDRGCTKDHSVHELFCADAKVFAVQNSQSRNNQTEGVVLLIMQVRTLRKDSASVFWDNGSDSNFVRDAYAKKCGFKGKQVNLCVTTLGGVDKDYISVTVYTCYLVDVDGKTEKFDAYGMSCITGSVTKINFQTIKRLFPHLSDKFINKLLRGDVVDFLIGMLHPSWHPQRAEKAQGGGDFWVWRGRFGACIGGRHREMREETRKSENLFVEVHQVYCVATHREPSSHQLDFCPRRSKKYRFPSLPPIESKTQSDAIVNTVTTVEEVSAQEIYCECEPEECSAEISRESSSVVSLSDSVLQPDSSSSLSDSQENSPVLSAEAPEFIPRMDVSSVSDSQDSADGLNVPSTVDVSQSDGELVVVRDEAEVSSEVLPECASCLATVASPLTDEDLFFQSQALGTVVEPKCGGCKCSKCSIPGMKYSFKEQQEFDIIQKNLFYCAEHKRWVTEYPWATDRSRLPRNEKAAFQWLLSLERSLKKDPELADDYCQQIKDMLDRGAAIFLSEEELNAWDKDYHYLPLLGVKGKKKWLRVVFDAARRLKGFPCINDCVHKGPDRFINNLLAVLLGFRNGRVAAAADLSKFHNQVHLITEDVHMQRFFWRDMKTDEPPKTYAVAVNNFGVKPANVIATSALHKSADCFAEKYPVESEEIKNQTYVDDELVAAVNDTVLREKTRRMDEICDHASMPNKGWTYSGDSSAEVAIGDEASACEDKVLGMLWDPSSDTFNFYVVLKLLTTNGEVSVSSLEHLIEISDSLLLTRRVLLSNVSRIFDPIGLLAPVLLEAKLLMRESWCGKNVGWDDVVPPDQFNRWFALLSSLLSLNNVTFKRSLWPEEEVVGLPILVVFSDGAALAFGASAYIRWELESGGFWSRLIMAKCRIAPKNIITIPRMELNGSVIGNRIKNFIIKETNLKFSKTYQFVDSSTVLGYVQKECGVFRPYEGVRVAEIQSSNKFVNSTLEGWAWVAGSDNPSDWCTKPRSVEEVRGNRFWVDGPDFLQQHESTWPIKLTYKKDNLEGELNVPRSVKCLHVQVHHQDFLGRLVNRSSSWTKAVRVLAWMLRYVDCRHIRRIKPLTAEEVARAKKLLIKYSQRELLPDLEQAAKGKGKFRKLCPMLDEDGIWRVGSRLKVVPFTLDAKLPALLPNKHRITLLVMRKAHQHSHLRQDGTVARFRCDGFWTIRSGNLAKSIVEKCVTCRELDHRTLKQQMGSIPEDRLNDPFAWSYCQLDLFGPFKCRGDVNARTTKKTWGVIVEDTNSGAVHLDIVQDYSAPAVILSLRRFGSLRGWPGVINTDPGSQLESAGGRFEAWWSAMGESLRTFSGSKNFKWNLSPADSPWRQGKAERRIAIVKRCLALAIGDSRVTPVELQTILMEVANICNERPIGLSKPRADGTYSLITPNQLLLGRSKNILPDDTEIVDDLPMKARYRIVHDVTTDFWKRWSAEVSPSLVVRQKWHEQSRNLRIGDLVRICEPSKLKAKYKLGIVDAVTISSDGNVRSAIVRYVLLQKNSKGDDTVRVIRVSRSVQRLVLILPVEEQDTPLVITDDEVVTTCTAQA